MSEVRLRAAEARRAQGEHTLGKGAGAAEVEVVIDRADPDGCNRASEEAWGNPFPSATLPPGATQGISTTDHPSSDFLERRYVFR